MDPSLNFDLALKNFSPVLKIFFLFKDKY